MWLWRCLLLFNLLYARQFSYHSFIHPIVVRAIFLRLCFMACIVLFFFFGCLKRLFWARWLKTIWYASLTMSLSCWWKLRVKKRQSTISTAWLIADRRIVCSTFSVSLNCQICFICCWLLLLVLLLEHLPLQYSIWKYSMQQKKVLFEFRIHSSENSIANVLTHNYTPS